MYGKACLIIGAADFNGAPYNLKFDLIIAADGGYAHVKKIGLKPDIVVGDFDSLGYVPENENIIRHPVMKDETDLMLAVDLGLEQGCDTFFIYGGIGGKRLDHTIGNIQLLSYMTQKNAHGFLIGDHEIMTVISDEDISFDENAYGNISVFSLTDISYNVCEAGLLYELDHHMLYNHIPMGISNQFKNKDASISVEKGALLIIWEGKFLPKFSCLSD